MTTTRDDAMTLTRRPVGIVQSGAAMASWHRGRDTDDSATDGNE